MPLSCWKVDLVHKCFNYICGVLLYDRTLRTPKQLIKVKPIKLLAPLCILATLVRTVAGFLLHLFSRLDLSAYLKSISLIMILMSSSIKPAIMGC